MAEQDVLYSKENGIAVVTFNRPDKLNSVTNNVISMVSSIVEEIKRDDEVRVVIVTGNGRAFCAGTDISSGSALSEGKSQAETNIDREKQKKSTYDRGQIFMFNNIPKPIICAINGAAVGLGAEIPLMCDVRIASESARWGQVFVLRALVPDAGAGTYLLPRILGLSKACELVLSGEIINAQEMLRIGLVSKVVPNEQLMTTAMEMAKKLKRGAPLAVQMAKQLMYRGLDRTVEDHIQAEFDAFTLLSQTEDAKEGVKSFLEKREPRWLGR